jgi:hypothetical protein
VPRPVALRTPRSGVATATVANALSGLPVSSILTDNANWSMGAQEETLDWRIPTRWHGANGGLPCVTRLTSYHPEVRAHRLAVMAYQIFRVEITRDETRDGGAVTIEITAYIDRMPETNEATRGRLSRAWRGVWNSRLQFTGDFETLAEALTAIAAAHPDADHIRCYEYSVDNEFPIEVPPLVRSGQEWRPGSGTG